MFWTIFLFVRAGIDGTGWKNQDGLDGEGLAAWRRGGQRTTWTLRAFSRRLRGHD